MADSESTHVPGHQIMIDSSSPIGPFGVFFEDDGDTGYFYALSLGPPQKIVSAEHIYNVRQFAPSAFEIEVKIRWSSGGDVSVLSMNGQDHAVFDFKNCRGSSRTNFGTPTPPWSSLSWDDPSIRSLLEGLNR